MGIIPLVSVNTNDKKIAELFKLKLNNEAQAENVGKHIASIMNQRGNEPKSYTIRWTTHSFGSTFRFILTKGATKLAETPEIKTTKDHDYPFYLRMISILQHKGVNCNAVGAHFKHPQVHKTKGFI